MANEIGDLGNGTGYLYEVDQTGALIHSAVPNDARGARKIRGRALLSGLIPEKQVINDDTLLQQNYDDTFGRRYYINADYTATATKSSLTNAVEITKFLVGRGMEQNIPVVAATVSTVSTLTVGRKAAITHVIVDTNGAAATDILEFIDDSFVHGDLLILTGANSARVVQVQDQDNASPAEPDENIYLSGNNDFFTGDETKALLLRFHKPSGDPNGSWKEVTRSFSASVDYGYVNQRADGVAQPVPGVEEIALTTAGGTLNREAGVDKGIIEIQGTTIGNMLAGFVLQGHPTPTAAPIDGDRFRVKFSATGVNLNGQTITVFGQTITQIMLDSVPFGVEAWWNDDDSAWVSMIVPPNSVPVWEAGSGTDAVQTKGLSNDASGTASVAEGNNTTASGNYSHSEGNGTTASGVASHAEGSSNTASGDNAHAEGTGNTASGDNSHVGGKNNVASDFAARVFGQEGVSRFPNQLVHGFIKDASQTYQQYERIALHGETTDASTISLLVQDGAAGTEAFAIPSNTIISGKLTIVAQQYAGSTGTAAFSAVAEVEVHIKNVAGTSAFLNEPFFHGRYVKNEAESGTCPSGGSATTIVLASGAPEWDDALNGRYIYLTAGTSAGDVAFIRDYVGSTRTATVVTGSWTSTPDATTQYEILKWKEWEDDGYKLGLSVTVDDPSDALIVQVTGIANRSIWYTAVFEGTVINFTTP